MTPPSGNRLLVWAIVGSQFGPPFMFSGVAVALPSLGADLGAGATALGLVETTFLAGSMAFVLPVGRLADAADKRSLYKGGLLVFLVLSAALGLLSWLPAILVLRFLQGLMSAVFAAIGPALLAELVPEGQRGRTYGASMATVYAGLSLGPVAAGWLVDHWGWRAVFLGGAAVMLLCLLPVVRLLPSRWRRPERTVHRPSTALLVAAVLAVVFGCAELRSGAAGAALLALGLLLSAAFVAVQQRTPRPLVDLRALRRNRALRAALLVQLLLYLNAFCSMFLLSLFLQVTRGLDARHAGLVLATGSVVMAFVAPVAGALADRFRPGAVAAAGAGAVLLSSVLATTLTAGSTALHAALVLVAQGVGFGLFSSPNMAIIMASMPLAQSGMAAALATQARSIGMVGGMLVTAALISFDFGDDPVARHPLRLVDTMTTMYAVLACTAGLALAVAFAARGPRRDAS